jgi:hypothetical protein
MTRVQFPFWMKGFDDWYDIDGGASLMTVRYNVQKEAGAGRWCLRPILKYSMKWWNIYDKEMLVTEDLLIFLRNNKWEQ